MNKIQVDDILENEYEYTELDHLIKRHEIAEQSYNKMMNNMTELWENIMVSYLDEIKGHGVLNKLTYNKFVNFMVNDDVCEELIDARQMLENYMKHNDKTEEDSDYIFERKNDAIKKLKKIHMKLLDDNKIDSSDVKLLYSTYYNGS